MPRVRDVDDEHPERVPGEVGALADDLRVVDPEREARRASLSRGRDETGRGLEDAEQPRLARVRDVPEGGAAAGGLDYARRRALERAQLAEAELEVLPPTAAREALRDSIAYAVERRS